MNSIGVIGIHIGDDPRSLAENFWKIYHLDDEAQDALFEIIVENMNSESFAKLQNEQSKKTTSIDPIEEAKENEEMTSYYQNSMKSKKNPGESFKNLSYTNNKSNAKIQFTSNKNIQSEFSTPEQKYEEGHASFNKQNESEFTNSQMYPKESFQEEELVMGEDIDYSPDSSVRIPHGSITEQEVMEHRQERFFQDRMSSIHKKDEKQVSGRPTRAVSIKRNTQHLEAVKEMERESESRLYNEGDSSQNHYYGIPGEGYRSGPVTDREEVETEIVAVEVSGSDFDNYSKY